MNTPPPTEGFYFFSGVRTVRGTQRVRLWLEQVREWQP
jgi:hypothetical protein